MPPNELIGRLRGRRKAKVLVDAEWRPSPDFNVLADKIYKHIIRTDLSPLNGVPSVDVRKYLNWWKLRTCGRSVEFGNLAVRFASLLFRPTTCPLSNTRRRRGGRRSLSSQKKRKQLSVSFSTKRALNMTSNLCVYYNSFTPSNTLNLSRSIMVE